MKVYSLRARLSLTYAMLALLLIGIISFFVNYFFKVQFNDYVIVQQKQTNQNIVNLVEKQYDVTTGKWNVDSIENIGMDALEQGVILKVKDLSGTVVWDAKAHNNGLCVKMIDQMEQYTQSHNPSLKGGYIENQYDLKDNFKSVGNAYIGYYGPYYYTSNDVSFLNKINTILAAVGAASLGEAQVISMVKKWSANGLKSR